MFLLHGRVLCDAKHYYHYICSPEIKRNIVAIMKERLKKIYHANTGWWDSFTSCFVGTLLGIVITFGVSYVGSRKEEKATERKIQIITVGKMEQALDRISSRVEVLKQSDSIYVEVLGYWQDDRLDEIPEGLVVTFYEKLMEVSVQSQNISAIEMFRSNVEIWKTMHPVSIDAMERLLDVIESSYGIISKVDSELGKIRSNIMEKYVVTGFNSHTEVVEAIFSNPENGNLLTFAHMYIWMLVSLEPHYEVMLQELKDYLGITDKEMDALYEIKVYEDFSVRQDSI